MSDEGVVARWMENPYMQYFTGEKMFQKCPTMNPIDMTKFRKRVGEKGAEKIFRISLMVNDIARKKFCKLAGIDPVIGHLKSDHRMMRNYLKGTLGAPSVP